MRLKFDSFLCLLPAFNLKLETWNLELVVFRPAVRQTGGPAFLTLYGYAIFKCPPSPRRLRSGSLTLNFEP